MSRDVYEELLDPLFSRVTTMTGSEAYLAAIDKESRPLILLYAADLCAAEVQNGGFLQLFYNCTGVVVPEAIEGFHALHMPQTAGLVEEASKPLGSPYPRDEERRHEALLRAPGKSLDEIESIAKDTQHPFIGFREVTKDLDFDALSSRFWELVRSENGGKIRVF